MKEEDEYWIREALKLSLQAKAENEVPVGAILTQQGRKISEAWNKPIGLNDPCAHAEILTLRKGGACLQNYRLIQTTLYVTLEPCAMCAGAMVHARIERLVFGAFDLKAGAAGSVINLLDGYPFNHKVFILGGVLEKECGQVLKDFFKSKR